ncbi:MAG TPA: chemotaxis protein CheW [Ktedonobacteraceae bacterium]|nr:chemotaxis protein CheW [Ktedonobacteraceae bacterium]
MLPFDALPAQRLWDMSDEEFWAYARELAGGGSSTPVRADAGQYLEIMLSRGMCLTQLSSIEEVLPSPSHYTLLPSVPGWMLGLAAWRGEVMAVVDLEMYLVGHTDSRIGSGGLLLCLHYGELALGLFVPAVGETVAPGGEPQQTGAAALDFEALLADIARQIGMAAHNV